MRSLKGKINAAADGCDSISVYHAKECNRPAGPHKKVRVLIVAYAHGLHAHIKLWYQKGATLNLSLCVFVDPIGIYCIYHIQLYRVGY